MKNTGDIRTFSLAVAALAVIAGCSNQGNEVHISGVHLNSQVLEGEAQGVRIERKPQEQRKTLREQLEENRRLAEQRRTQRAAEKAQAQALALQEVEDVTAQGEAARVQADAQPKAEVAPTQQARRPAVELAPKVASAPSFVGQKKTVVGLGDPGRDGLWMETPLVSSRRNAQVTAPNGKSVVLTLEPASGSDGAGSRLSISAMRALGLPLTELVEVSVGPV